MSACVPRAVSLLAWALALGLGAGALGCRKASKEASPPSLANLVLSPSSAARNDGGGSLPVSFAVDVSDAGADVTDVVVTILDGSGAPVKRLTGKTQNPPGATSRRLSGTLSIPTSAVASYTVEVQVFDSGGSASNVVAASFEVVPGNPVPILLSVSPPGEIAGSAGFTLTVTGSGFLGGSIVLWNGVELPTTYVDPSTLTAQVPGGDIASPGTSAISVRNPAPGGGRSAALPFPVALPSSVFTLTCRPPGLGFGEFVLPPGTGGVLPFLPLTSLKTVPNPVIPVDTAGAALVREDLVEYVADLASAIQLGKALFWDVQAGSDDATACATCHHQAGADVRITNQLNPGADGLWGRFGAILYGPNFTLTAADFPFTDPAASRDVDDVAGSQGVRSSLFAGIGPGGEEQAIPAPDPVFGTFRQATGLNTPTAIGAVFNHRSFFNGRAQFVFNGANPFGDRDGAARVWKVVDALGTIAPVQVRIPGASLASQAVGPPLNPTEMSAAGRTFPELGRKLLRRRPLGLQVVSATDGVLGPLADPAARGLATSYAALIRSAFQPRWWNAASPVTLDGKAYSLMEADFSLFWGLSIMLYEATLVPDDSPMDRYVATRVFDVSTATLASDDPAQLDPVVNRLAAEGIGFPLAGGGTRPITRADILAGLELFEKPIPLPGVAGLPPGAGLGCSLCHAGAETTSASLRKVTTGIDVSSVAFEVGGFDLRMERMFMGLRTPAPPPPQPPPPVPLGTDAISLDAGRHAVTVVGIGGAAVEPLAARIDTYDTGWYNLGVRPTAENLGLGGVDPFGQPLSFTELYRDTLPDPSVVRVPGSGLGCMTAAGIPLTPPAAPLTSKFAGEVLAPGTSFPLLSGGLTRTEPTAVAGGFKTSSLRNVELTGPYFHNGGKATLRQVVEFYDDGGDFANEARPPLVRPLGLTPDQVAALVAFLVSLTDERVLYQRAPFDHPELPLPSGQDADGKDVVTLLPAVGAEGAATPAPRFLGLNPFQP
ncbi:MAG TPA: cytochrome c peroxidase [Anaeromyxobacter sp.]